MIGSLAELPPVLAANASRGLMASRLSARRATVGPVNPPLSPATYIGHLRADAERMAAAYRTGPVEAPVAACPGWDVTALVEHMAFIHRWADYAVRNAVAAGPEDVAHPG